MDMESKKGKKIRKCPICKEKYCGYPAISRKDNKTPICPKCGQKEALEDFVEHKKLDAVKEDLEIIIDLTKCDDSLFSDGIELDIRSVAERALKRL